jgi:hypothetical protein
MRNNDLTFGWTGLSLLSFAAVPQSRFHRRLLALAEALLLPLSGSAGDTMSTALSFSVSQPPTPVPSGGRPMLVYELLLWNSSTTAVVLKRLDVDAANKRRMASFEPEDLGRRPWHSDRSSSRTTTAGGRLVIYVDWRSMARAGRRR